MARRYIDLSLTIDPEQTWVEFPRSKIYGKPNPPMKIEPIATIAEKGIFNNYFCMTTQMFTHYDAPSHFVEAGPANHEVPIDWLCGEAVVIDMMHKQPREYVTAADLEAAGVDVRPGDIAIIRTGWTDRAWGNEQFWLDMIGLSKDAADWLIAKGIKALVQDFMTDDPPLSPPPGSRWPEPGWHGNHKKFLPRNICLIEWCTNLGAITKPRVQLICLPIKLKGTDGAPCRVIAIEED